MKRSGKILGLAMGSSSVTVAEVAAGAGKARVLRAGEFVFPQGVGIEKSAELGKALGAFLKEKGFGERDAAVGLPAKWLVTRRKELPPASKDAAASSLRLQAEGDFAGDIGAMVIDYAGTSSTAKATSVLVVGTAKAYVDGVLAMAKAAGLRVHAITSTGAALSAATAEKWSGDGVVMNLGGDEAEMIVRQGGALAQLRHVGTLTADVVPALTSEVRRTLGGMSGSDAAGLTIWDGANVIRASAEALKERLGIDVKVPGPEALATWDEGGAARYAGAAAVGLSALRSLAVDFMHSRLAEPPAKTNRSAVIWLGGIAAAVVVTIALGIADLKARQGEVAGLRARLTAMEADASKAEAALSRLTAARGWYPSKPAFVACLRDMTVIFPDEGTIWASRLALHADMSGQIMGRASSEQQVLGLSDRMRLGKRFANPQVLDMRREIGRSGAPGDVSFSISFTYRPE